MHKLRMPFIIALCTISSIQLFAQEASVNWSVDVSPVKRFIENKSQFDGRNELPGSEILYGVHQGSTQIYFTKNGLTYRFDKKEEKNEEEERRREAEKLKTGNYPEEEGESDVVHMEWVNANPNARLTGIESGSDHFSYMVGEMNAFTSINHIKGYKKLLYENLYANIDVEYEFHPEGGIKYQLILKPGADVSNIRMKYSETDEVSLDEAGNIRIGTEFGDIIDHAPVTFYSGNEKKHIQSKFNISGNTVSFQLGNYDPAKPVVIDPWTLVPNLPFANKAYYVKADSSGNAYVYGGDSPHTLQKYNAAGALQWTYFTPWTSADWFGALAVDPVGNSYITKGVVGISKIDSSGALVWSNSPGSFYEYWAPTFNCDYTQLLVGGTWMVDIFSFKFNGAAYEIDLNSGAIDTFIIVSGTLIGAPNTPPFIANEIRTMCYSQNGNYYYMTLDTIGSLSPSLDINYRDSSLYNFSYYLPYGTTGGGQGNNGICATRNLLYTTDGKTLRKRNIIDGSVIKSITIPNGSKEINSGVAVDDCGNVYVGAVGRVHKYDADLNLLFTANTSGEVYDVAVAKNGEVFACGHGFVTSIAMNGCRAIRPFCLVKTSQTNLECNSECTGTATATGMNGAPPYSYKWSDGQTTSTATSLCAGTHVVTVTDASGDSVIASVDITEPSAFLVYASSSTSGCSTGAAATPSFSVGPYHYTWSNGENTPSIENLETGTYSVTVYDGNNCSATDSVSVVETGFKVSTSFNNPDCGSCNGVATAVVTGTGTLPFSYEWSSGDTTSSISSLCAGSYSLTVTEGGVGGNTVFWSEDFTNGGTGWMLNLIGPGANDANANLWIINSATGCSQCPVSGSGGNYLHVTCGSGLPCTGNQGDCTYDPGIFIFSNSSTDKYVTSPNISTVGKTGITLTFGYMSDGQANADYGLVRLSSDGGATWTDLPTQYSGTPFCTQASVLIPTAYENIPDLQIGFRWVNNSDFNGNSPPFMIDDIELSSFTAPCSATGIVNVNSVDGPEITLDSLTDVSCFGNSDGAIDISIAAGVPPYTYSWSNGVLAEDISGLSGGTYVVIVTDSADCISAFAEEVDEPAEAISISGTTTASGCSPTGAISIAVIGGTFPYTYSWTTGGITEDIANVSAGNHSVTVTDNRGCTESQTFTVTGLPTVAVTLAADSATCNGVADGEVTTTVLSGTQPFTYSWSNGAVTQSIDNVPSGNYTLKVTDSNNCTAVESATVSAPNKIRMIASITKVLCEGGNNGGIKLIPSGGTPEYAASWSNGQMGLTLTALPPDVYTVTVTDSKGCTADSSFSLTAVSIYTVETAATAALCDGTPTGTVQATIISPTTPPYAYLWSTGDTTAIVSNVSPGIYWVTVSDSLDCLEADTVEVPSGLKIEETVIRPCPLQLNGSIITVVTGGNEPYEYIWNTGATSPSLINVGVGVYSLTVTDQNDCKGADTIFVLTDSSTSICDTLIFYDVFSPNGDGINEQWVVDGLLRFPESELQIFNRWGNVVFEVKPYNNDWDGTSKKGELLPSATYYFILKLNDGKESVYSGNITLLR